MALPEAIAAAKLKFPESVGPHVGTGNPDQPRPSPRDAAPGRTLLLPLARHARGLEGAPGAGEGTPNAGDFTPTVPDEQSGCYTPTVAESCCSGQTTPAQVHVENGWKILGAPGHYDAGGKGPADCHTQ